MMIEANITRLVSKLSQMHGAALKLGQLMSIPGAHSSFIIFLFLSVPVRSFLTRDARHLHSPSWCRRHLPPRPGQRTLHARLANATSASNIPGRNNGLITLYPSTVYHSQLRVLVRFIVLSLLPVRVHLVVVVGVASVLL
jgi:hypothetical protein